MIDSLIDDRFVTNILVFELFLLIFRNFHLQIEEKALMRQRHNYDSRGVNDNVSGYMKSSTVNLSRLSMSKGKFSLSTKYNSTHNNNYHSKFNSKSHNQSNNQIKHPLLYQSESNKQNVSLYANADRTLAGKNYTLFSKKTTNQHYQQYNYDYDDEYQQSRRIQQIRGIANNIVDQQRKNDNQKKQFNKDRSNNFKQQKQKDNININTNKSNTQRRRSKFHKYDNINSENNEFLFIENDQSTQVIIDKCPSIKVLKKQTIREQEKSKEQDNNNKQLNLVIEQLRVSLQSQSKQLQHYKQSIKQISYSMIRMISLMSRFQQLSERKEQSYQNGQYMRLLRKQIAQIYTKQLVYYIDKLNIRQQLVELAERESKNKIINDGKKKEEQNGKECTLVDDGHGVSATRCGQLLHNACSRQSINDDNDSLFNYELTSVKQQPKDSNPTNHHNHPPNHNQNSSLSLQLDFNNNLPLQMVHSGRNLLDTFNHQYLKQQFGQFDSDEENIEHDLAESYNILSTAKQQILAENLHYALMKDGNCELQSCCSMINRNNNNNTDPSSQSFNVCRKLFEQNNTTIQQQQQYQQSNLTTKQNQTATTPTLLIPENSYKLIISIGDSQEQTTSNYLKIQLGSVFKLLRKVDSNRWIAECNDKIGFILQNTIVGRIVRQQSSDHMS